jgi:hypothetical protein
MDPACMLAGFPSPWTVVETTGEFIVKDANGRALAHFFWWGDPKSAHLTRDEQGAWRRSLPRCRALWCGSRRHLRLDSAASCRSSWAWRSRGCAAPSTAKILEPVRRQCRVDGRARDRPMAEPSLDRPGVVALVGQRVAAGVAQHVGMGLDLKLGASRRALRGQSRPWGTAIRVR